jgi:uncharacterized protein YbaR (Trm112 family)
MALAPDLLSLLACPEDKGPLYYLEDLAVLYNPRLQRAYRVRDGIPVMLIDEAQRLEPSENERLWARVQAENIRPTFESATFPPTETETDPS